MTTTTSRASVIAEADAVVEGEGVYAVYRYDFPDGSAYVGHTRRPLAERHYAHTAQPSNRYLLHQLRRWPEVRPTVVSRHPHDLAAIQAERAEIAGLERPLNSVWLSTQRYVPPGCVRLDDADPAAWALMGRGAGGRIRKRTRRYPRATTGLYRCRICLQRKPPDDYHTGQLRSSGLSSRCRSCSSILGIAMRDARRRHADTGQAYRDAIDAIRAGDTTAYLPVREVRVGRDGLWLCLLCRDRKPRHDYDIHLGNPRSRCKSCIAAIKALTRAAMRDGADRPAAHRSAVDTLRRRAARRLTT